MPGPHTSSQGASPTPDALGSQSGVHLDSFKPEYYKMKCTHKDGTFVGYLASSSNNYLWLTKNSNDGSWVQWSKPADGSLWLQVHQQILRYLGDGDYDYACWGLPQAPGVGPYTQPLIYNNDKTISMAVKPAISLYGPYGDQWVCWGPTDDKVLVCTME